MTNFDTNLHSRNDITRVKDITERKKIVIESKMTDQNAEDDIEKSVDAKTESDGYLDMNPNPSGTSESMNKQYHVFTF